MNLIEQFNEVKDIIPIDKMGMNRDIDRDLYEDVLDWCRDYFNEPKNPLLAYLLIGNWFAKTEPKGTIKYKVINWRDCKHCSDCKHYERLGFYSYKCEWMQCKITGGHRDANYCRGFQKKEKDE